MDNNEVMFRPNGEFETITATMPFQDEFSLPPPRELSPVVVDRIRGKARGMGIFFLLFGGIFLLVGLPLSLVFFPWHFQDSLALSGGGAATVPGRITSVTDTGYKVNGSQVHQFFYTFEVDGGERDGQCYFAGGNYPPGCPIRVQYLRSRPELNCVVGGTFDPGGNFAIFVVIFPIIGAAFFGYGVWAATAGASRSLALARNGFLAPGRVTAVERTNLRVNRQYRHRVTVDFDALGPRRMTYSAYGADVERARRWMEQSAVVRVLHDRHRPERAVLLEHLLS